jgi:glutamate/tyrosine decarboxylase-like PLP-dependent enzyme
VGVVADLVASALNQNVTSWRSAPGATTVERLVIEWFKEMVGYPAEAGGLLVGGGSAANLAALAAARARLGAAVHEIGLAGSGARPVVYASDMVHLSVPKAAALLGLGRRAVRAIPSRDDFTMDVAALAAAIDEDRSAGRQPLMVVASAGDVNTGAVDPLDEVADVCRERGLWFHVDGAYGGFATLAPSLAPGLAGIERADSVSLDPHKWLFAPIDAGCLLVRDPRSLAAAFAGGAGYVDVVGGPGGSEFAFWDYGPELTRRFRALKIWMILKRHGSAAVGRAIEENVRLAGLLAERVRRSADFELLAPARLSIVCFRHVPPPLRAALGSPDAAGRARALERVDALNRRILVEVQRGGHAVYVSNATLRGAFALRACLANYRTTEADLDTALEAIRAIGEAVCKDEG